jgi:hypothetical protein
LSNLLTPSLHRFVTPNFHRGVTGKTIACWARVAFSIALLFSFSAYAIDNGQYENVPPHIRNWFNNLKNPNGGMCCSLADGHRLDGDDVSTMGPTWYVFVEDDWWEVPADRIVTTEGNPVGQAVVFYRTVQRPNQKLKLDIFCFVPPGGV